MTRTCTITRTALAEQQRQQRQSFLYEQLAKRPIDAQAGGRSLNSATHANTVPSSSTAGPGPTQARQHAGVDPIKLTLSRNRVDSSSPPPAGVDVDVGAVKPPDFAFARPACGMAGESSTWPTVHATLRADVGAALDRAGEVRASDRV